ncbi:hypothetical protein NBG4_990005 [Candidatus Sulfobium mesophilum]|uniref:Uncharacterized protein n=1 Tax=Candidatus Sulfobium mesophilum TaxID=2016548 RepID=A0A2U3QLD3_9BACT|nr:hypothetical protein NBG4_990005 [Candidatus Sulfobium mesophilum]
MRQTATQYSPSDTADLLDGTFAGAVFLWCGQQGAIVGSARPLLAQAKVSRDCEAHKASRYATGCIVPLVVDKESTSTRVFVVPEVF